VISVLSLAFSVCPCPLALVSTWTYNRREQRRLALETAVLTGEIKLPFEKDGNSPYNDTVVKEHSVDEDTQDAIMLALENLFAGR
jgi:hypothetical protein